jgi:hypothetical protein
MISESEKRALYRASKLSLIIRQYQYGRACGFALEPQSTRRWAYADYAMCVRDGWNPFIDR